MDWPTLHSVLVFIQRSVSAIGILIIISGVLLALYQYAQYLFSGQSVITHGSKINSIRLNLARILILGLEFIVAADLIGSTTAPDYYTVGLLAIIVLIRTLLTFSINRELLMIRKER